jgi:hypothetical protein
MRCITLADSGSTDSGGLRHCFSANRPSYWQEKRLVAHPDPRYPSLARVMQSILKTLESTAVYRPPPARLLRYLPHFRWFNPYQHTLFSFQTSWHLHTLFDGQRVL